MKVSAIKYFKIYRILLKLSLQSLFAFRLDVLANFLATLLGIISFWILIEVIFNQVGSIAGWNKFEILLIYGLSRTSISLLRGFIFDNMRELSSLIVDGRLDVFLTKPISALFMISFYKIDVFRLLEVLIGVIITIYAVINLHIIVTIGAVLLLLICLLLTLIIFYSLLLTLFSGSFWLGQIGHGYWVFEAATDLARLPVSALQGVWYVLFAVLVPFVLFGAIPAGILINRIDNNVIIILALVASIWFTLANLIWKKGLRSYTSGGG